MINTERLSNFYNITQLASGQVRISALESSPPLSPLCVHAKSLQPCTSFFAALWTVAHQAPLSMGLFQARTLEQLAMPSSRASYQPRDRTLPLIFPALAGEFFTTSATWEIPKPTQFSSVQFSHSVISDSLRPHETQHARPPCPSPIPGVHSDSRPLSQ